MVELVSGIVPGKEIKKGKEMVFEIGGGRCRVYLKILFIKGERARLVFIKIIGCFIPFQSFD